MRNLKYHPDFDIPWCQNLLASHRISDVQVPTEHRLRTDNNDIPSHDGVSNSMFAQTLYTPSAIRAQINFKRPRPRPRPTTPETAKAEADSLESQSSSQSHPWESWEYCYLLSLGSGVDGKTGRAHGGFNALILDQMTGSVASMVSGSVAPATATLTVDYKAPIATPGVVLCRGWAVERQGRKTWVRAQVEDGQGNLLASGKALFIDPKPTPASTPRSDKL